MNPRRLLAPVIGAVGAALLLTGCSVAVPHPADPAKTGVIAVVASTDVWGSVAAAVGGEHISVTSIIDDPSKDPHDYQADARNQLAIARANVIVANGGGYDDFVGTMAKAAKQRADIVTAAAVAGAGHANEHYWYDFPTVRKMAARLADAFGTADPGNAAVFQANARGLESKLRGLEATEAQLKRRYAGTAVTITEPVPLYLLDAVGLKNVTPVAFSTAIENGTDVAPPTLRQTLALYQRDTPVKLLVDNAQTTSSQTRLVIDAAEKQKIPVVAVTETLPAGTTYIEWMTANLTAIGAALAK